MTRRLRSTASRIVAIARRVSKRPAPYVPHRYWERRAADLIATYDAPETWGERQWLRAGIEEIVVPTLLKEHSVSSVLVAGAGSGRQYDFLAPLDLELRGFDISPTLVAACRARHPSAQTIVCDISKARGLVERSDAVLSTAVLQHVPPAEINQALGSLESLADRLLVLREATFLANESHYQWAHPYESLLRDAGWELVYREITDKSSNFMTELMAWRPPTRS
jgi:SAM-dependent methyltransferase